MKLVRTTYCTKPGRDGCVNTEGAEHAPAGWSHWCPACNTSHYIAVEHPLGNGARWTFNGDMDKPTFGPSVHIKWGPMPATSANAGLERVCHYFIRQGRIEYCADSTHALAGQTVDLPEMPKDEC